MWTYTLSINITTAFKHLGIHSFSQYEYFNAVLINEVDEEGNNVELGGEFLLEPNDHFNNLSVNLSLSVVQVPTNMYNKGESSACTQGLCVLFTYCELINGEEKRREESKWWKWEMVAEAVSVSQAGRSGVKGSITVQT